MTEDIYAIYQRPKDPTDFEAVRIRLASPEKIREWSYGEVKKPETINYRTFKPERDGLFCAKIFGPIKDWECICGKYKRIKHSGVLCDKCGVEIIQSKVRRERLGHIELAAPVAHIWYIRSRPSIIGSLLDISTKDLEKVLYFESYVTIDPGDTPLKENELLTEEEYKKKISDYGSRFKAGMGAEAIRELLRGIDIDDLSKQLKQEIRQTRSETNKEKIAKRLRIVEAFRKSGNKPEWMIMDTIPVVPPDLRPLVPLEGGRFATSDLNDLYRRVINRNNRNKRLMELKAPSVIIKNEKRMLQEAVDALFDNGRRSRVLKTTTKRPLKSLSDMIKGKQGRFRQNLLGKRVDYSGRSVIVVGPELKLHQCGLPKRMALELFKPFIFNKLEEKGYATTIKAAKKLVEKETAEVWDALEEVIREHPVLLNRAPTLHRLGIQAFDPILVEGKAIKLHPLVCAAFNADFDGDQMAVHVPLSIEAQIEARVLMLSVNNILSNAEGNPVIMPSQDIVLGIYYLTKEKTNALWDKMTFSDTDEMQVAYDAGVIDEHTKIRVRLAGEIVETTTGRVLVKEILPCGFPFVLINKVIRKQDITEIIKYLHSEFGAQDTVEFLNKFTDLGFRYATRSGISICMDDIMIPVWKDSIVEDAKKKEKEFIREFNEKEDDDEFTGCSDVKNKISNLWQKALKLIDAEVIKTFEKFDSSFNSIYMMIDSQARGKWEHLSQIAGIRGLVSCSVHDSMPYAITSNYKEALTPFEYYLSASQLHKSFAYAQKFTTDAGWLMRRLVDTVQDIIVIEDDCGTLDGIYLSDNIVNAMMMQSFEERVVGRISAEEVRHPETGGIILKQNEEITETIAIKITGTGTKTAKVRSVLTCQSINGICAKCYGRDLSTGRIIENGLAVGIIAAQSIAEKIVQLALNVKHIYGGIPDNSQQSFFSKILKLFEARIPKEKTSKNFHEILAATGTKEALFLLLNELQCVVGQQDISIADKHFEVILRRMAEKIKVEDAGGTLFIKGELVQRQKFFEENTNVQLEGGKPAIGKPVILGLTKASLSSDSWISAASFQETTRILTESAITGAVDELRGLKENVIIGRMIPAGTGMSKYRKTFVKREICMELSKEEKGNE